MFDVGYSELLAVAVVALLVIGPKDLPKAMRFVGQWVGRARGVARQFRSGFDSMVREAELAEMEKKWAEENKRIMQEHGAGAVDDAGVPASPYDAAADGEAGTASSDDVGSSREPDLFSQPVFVEQPVIRPAPDDVTSSDADVPTPPVAATAHVEVGEPAATAASAPKANS
jgi:sec-independent protein translocase protein TatB